MNKVVSVVAVVLVALTVSLSAVSCTSAEAQTSAKRDRWEYSCVTPNSSLEDINKVGAEGWEAVGASISVGGKGCMLFKRKLP